MTHVRDLAPQTTGQRPFSFVAYGRPSGIYTKSAARRAAKSHRKAFPKRAILIKAR